MHVTNRLADKNIHKIIDTFKPELRSKENVNGKMRVREFFAMSAQEAVDLLSTIGSIYGETPQIFQQTTEEKVEQKIAEKTSLAIERKSPFSFYSCGIKNGEQIVYVHNESIVCKVVGDREISYNGKTTSLSALAQILLNRKSGVQGTLHFSYNGEVLSALRKRLEDEGQYITIPNSTTLSTQTPISNNTNDDNILYFITHKYTAMCRRQANGYLVLKGSQISPTFSNSCSTAIKNLRIKHQSKISADFIVTEDILFNSSSSAAVFVAGTSKSGNECWKNKYGVPLKNLH